MNYIVYLLLLGLLQNPNYQLIKVEYENSDIFTNKIDSSFWNIISPYKKMLDVDMNEVLCYSVTEMKKGQPESLLGNWTADLCLKKAQELFQDTIDMALFNNGGLRSSLSEGNITKREIYQLMPFENELVVLSLTLDDVNDLMNYLNHTGGQPSAFSDWFQIDELPFYVLTTDYLANGGDKMRFFNNKYQNVLGVKMRDAIIQYCSQKDTIATQLDNRHFYFMSDE
mgnify:CR=1 FL=1